MRRLGNHLSARRRVRLGGSGQGGKKWQEKESCDRWCLVAEAWRLRGGCGERAGSSRSVSAARGGSARPRNQRPGGRGRSGKSRDRGWTPPTSKPETRRRHDTNRRERLDRRRATRSGGTLLERPTRHEHRAQQLQRHLRSMNRSRDVRQDHMPSGRSFVSWPRQEEAPPMSLACSSGDRQPLALALQVAIWLDSEVICELEGRFAGVAGL